jgi:hypothetical protein
VDDETLLDELILSHFPKSFDKFWHHNDLEGSSEVVHGKICSKVCSGCSRAVDERHVLSAIDTHVDPRLHQVLMSSLPHVTTPLYLFKFFRMLKELRCHVFPFMV